MDNYEPALDAVFHALSDPTRRAVIHHLGTRKATVSELAQPHDMALPSFMKHLSVLEECGLIKSKKQGRVRTCQIVPQKLTSAETWMAEQRALWERRVDRFTEYVETLTGKEDDG